MQRIMVDEKLARELDHLHDQAELIDVSGQTLGQFVPTRQVLAARQTTPAVIERREREEILLRLVERMKAHPLPANAPRFTRDELHERS